MFQKRTFKIVAISLVLMLVLVVLVIKFNFPQQIKEIKASSGGKAITTDDEWNAGTLNNIQVSGGTISLGTGQKIDTTGMALSASMFDETKGNLVDGNTNTFYGGNTSSSFYWQIDFGQTFHLNEIKWNRFLTGTSNRSIDGSVNGTDWSFLFAGSNDPIDRFNSEAVNLNARYVRLTEAAHPPNGFEPVGNFYEMEFYQDASATHTSAATQIDGTEGGTKNFIGWETFTPSYTKPASTNVSFRLRTSADGATWTSWSASQTPATGVPLDISAIVDSGSGANKYLQVESTLSNTDGASTPTIDSYSASYHTNILPSTPTAMTAVVGG